MLITMLPIIMPSTSRTRNELELTIMALHQRQRQPLDRFGLTPPETQSLDEGGLESLANNLGRFDETVEEYARVVEDESS